MKTLQKWKNSFVFFLVKEKTLTYIMFWKPLGFKLIKFFLIPFAQLLLTQMEKYLHDFTIQMTAM